MDCSTPGFPISFAISWVCSDSCPFSQWCHPTISFCHPLPPLPSIFPRIRTFSNELTVCIRWPKYWSFNFSISSSNESSVLISFRINWFDLYAVQGNLKSLLQLHNSKDQFFSVQPSLWSNSHILDCGFPSVCPVMAKKAMATHPRTLAWKIPWMEESGRLQSMGSLRVRHDWAASLSLFTFMH